MVKSERDLCIVKPSTVFHSSVKLINVLRAVSAKTVLLHFNIGKVTVLSLLVGVVKVDTFRRINIYFLKSDPPVFFLWEKIIQRRLPPWARRETVLDFY